MNKLCVVFTGPAYDAAGTPILRADLALACQKKGMFVQSSLSIGTDLLVASRTDTQKAAKAASRGILTMTYPQFLEQFQVRVQPSQAAKPDPYVDTHRAWQGPHPGLTGGDEL